jgi:hypothetical protein
MAPLHSASDVAERGSRGTDCAHPLDLPVLGGEAAGAEIGLLRMVRGAYSDSAEASLRSRATGADRGGQAGRLGGRQSAEPSALAGRSAARTGSSPALPGPFRAGPMAACPLRWSVEARSARRIEDTSRRVVHLRVTASGRPRDHVGLPSGRSKRELVPGSRAQAAAPPDPAGWGARATVLDVELVVRHTTALAGRQAVRRGGTAAPPRPRRASGCPVAGSPPSVPAGRTSLQPADVHRLVPVRRRGTRSRSVQRYGHGPPSAINDGW